MTATAQQFAPLTEHIEGLEPKRIGPEIGDIVARGDAKSPLAAMVILHADGNTLQADDPLIGLLETVGTAIEKAPSPAITASLGEKAVGSIAGAMEARDFHPRDEASVTILASRAMDFTKLIEDPRDRAFAIEEVAKSIAKPAYGEAIRSKKPGTSLRPLFHLSAEHFDKAGEAALDVEDPEDRARTLSTIAKRAADNVLAASRSVDLGFEQPVRLFQKASETAMSIDDPVTRNRTRINIATDILGAAAATGQAGSPAMSGEFSMMALSEIDDVLDTYRPGGEIRESQEITPAERCYQLAESGERLARITREQYGSFVALTQERLPKTIVAMFSEARDAARTASGPERNPAATRSLSNVPSHMALTSAENILRGNPGAAKQLLAIGFDIAVAEDSDRGGQAVSRSAVLHTIGNLAQDETMKSAQTRFELFALAHKLESGHIEPGTISDKMQFNARQWLQSVRGYDEIKLDGDGYTFMEFAISLSKEDDHWAPNLRDAINVLENYPQLRQQAIDVIAGMDERQRQQRQPKTRSATLAKELMRLM